MKKQESHDFRRGSIKIFMTKLLKEQGFAEERVYRGPHWYYSGDNPIWLLRRKLYRRFHHCTTLDNRVNRYVFLIEAEKYAAYSDEIQRFKKQAEMNRNKANGQ